MDDVVAATLTTALAGRGAPPAVPPPREAAGRADRPPAAELALVGLGVVMTGTVLLIFDVAVGLGRATTAAVAVPVVLLLLALVPGRRLRGARTP